MATVQPLLNVRLLGVFQVRRGDVPIAEAAWSRRNARTLFKYLLLSPNHRCHKEQALDLLWPDLDPASAANNLHKTLFYLRRTLCPEAAEARACPYVEFDGDTIALALIGAVDVEAFEQRVRGVNGASDPSQYTAALDLYTGDLLPDDLYTDWAIPRREALRQTYLNLLRQLGELYLARREYEPAIAVWSHLLAAEPSNEDAHRALMRVYALNGQRHQALRQFHLCRQTLASDLNTEPVPETVALYNAIAKGDVGPELTLAPSTTFAASPHQLVGRKAELTQLLSVLKQAASGTPYLALVTGEGGIGKTRLAQEVIRLATEGNASILIGNTYEPVGGVQELPIPYGPFVDALRSFLQSQPPEVQGQLIGPWQADLSLLLPELGAGPTRLDSETAKHRLFEAVAYVLSAIADVQPVVLMFDDLHAADETTIDLLGYLLHRPSPFRVAVLALAREETLSPGNRATALAQLLARIARRNTLSRLHLTHLTESETVQVARDRLAGPVETAFVRQLYETSEGNPLFIEQLLQAWREESKLVNESGQWHLLPEASGREVLPPTLRETIALRLARLSAGAQSMLALAAVLGREFPYQWLQAASIWEEGRLLDLLDEALAMRVLEEGSALDGPLHYRFHHGLIRGTLYEGLSEARRRHLHQRVGETLESLPDTPNSTLSHHWFATGRWPWAFCHALTAADYARRAFAHAEAVALYDRALASARNGWSPDESLLARVHLGRAQALMGLNRSPDAVSDLEWLAERARGSGNRAAYGQAVSQLATAHFWGHNLDTARRLAQEALTIANETGDGMTVMMCTSNLGCIALSTGRLEQGTQYLETVLQQVRVFNQPNHIVEALACLPGGYHWQGQSERSLPLIEEGIAIARREGIGFWLGNLLFFAGLAHGSLCEYERALDYFREGQRHSQEAGDMFTAIRLANSFGWIHHELYDLQTALMYDRQGVEMARGFPWPEPLANALVNLGFDYLATTELAAAEEAFTEAAALLEHDEWMRWRWQTRLLLGQGWLALTRRDFANSENYAQQALSLAEETTAQKNQARAHLLLGEIALAKEDSALVIDRLQTAVRLAEAVNNPRLAWQSLEALAQAELARGNSQVATNIRSEAAQAIHRIASRLSDPILKRTFLDAPPVQAALQRP